MTVNDSLDAPPAATAGNTGDPAPMGRGPAALSGLVAAGSGLAVGHLVAAFGSAAASPVLALGSAVIDRTPTPVKDWAIREFGTADKLVLVASVSVVAAVLAAAAGLLARRRLVAGVVLSVALFAVVLAAVVERPAARPSDVVPALLAALVGVATLIVLLRLAAGRPVLPGSSYPGGHDTRRAFLAGSATASGVAVGSALWGHRLNSERPLPKVTLPAPAQRLGPLPRGLEQTYREITPLRTPNSVFYRVDTALSVPRVDPRDWSLRIDGDVEQPVTLSYDDLLAMDLIERDITMTCVSNTVGGGYIGAARWLGVRTRDVLAEVGVRNPSDPRTQVFSTSVEGFTVSTPVGALTDGRDALLAVGMNGSPLPARHGFPVRMVTPGLYGFVGSTKWVTSWRLTSYSAAEAYWTQRGWATHGPIKPSARIDTPRAFATVRGRTVIGGVAWAQRQGVTRVQVRIDDGAWQDCRSGPAVNVDYWRQWYFVWDDPTPGSHAIEARVLYGRGAKAQSDERAEVFPDGSSGIQRVVVTGAA